jgi:hypothetical protein
VSFWVKNTKKKEDAMLTFATISFAVTTLCFLLSAIGHISFGSFSADLPRNPPAGRRRLAARKPEWQRAL